MPSGAAPSVSGVRPSPVVVPAALTVAQYSARIASALRTVRGGIVEGEVQDAKSSPGGALFFTLTDGNAKLACKVFRAQVAPLKHHPREGDLVQVLVDRPDLWTQAGKLDVIVSNVRLAGEGELLRRREALLARLAAEGLCDQARWRPLPAFPRAVGVIAGRRSDGGRDVVQALTDRFPPVHLVTCAAVVQGAHAPGDIVDALVRMDAHPLVDVVIIARGGGSVHDLVAFDDEGLCRAVWACATPVIAAIGHTKNVPVCNHVTWSSQTPSRSAELAVPSAAALRQDLALAAARLAGAGPRLDALAVRMPDVDLGARALQVAGAARSVRTAEHEFFALRAHALAQVRERLASVPGRLPALPAGLSVASFSAALARRGEAASEQAARLRAGIRKELADHVYDYGRALPRLRGEIRDAVLRRLAEPRVGEAGERAVEGAARRLAGARRELGHAAALLAASDPRRRGWVLPTDAAGAVVRSVRALAPGDHVTLSFHDGVADTVVHHKEPA